jgi:hypothetical protein
LLAACLSSRKFLADRAGIVVFFSEIAAMISTPAGALFLHSRSKTYHLSAQAIPLSDQRADL